MVDRFEGVDPKMAACVLLFYQMEMLKLKGSSV